MVRKLIQWSLDNPLIVILLAVGLAVIGVYSFLHVNVEAYPDPAPPTVEVVALFPGASAEEVERQVTIPLEVALAGMPGLDAMHSKTVFGLSDIKVLFDYGVEYKEARQETINRLQSTPPLPPGVTPQISPESPTGEIFRYLLRAPKDAAGRNIYTLNDLKALAGLGAGTRVPHRSAGGGRYQLGRDRPPLRGAARSRPDAALRDHLGPIAERA